MTGGMNPYTAGAQAVGGSMQAIAASQAGKKMGKEFKREQQRQQGHRIEALDIFQRGVQEQSAETAESQINRGAQKRFDLMKVLAEAQFGLQPNMAERDKGAYRMRGMARARLGGISDWGLDQVLTQLLVHNDLNKVANIAAGDANLFPYRMDDAQHSMDELAFWGGMISSLGGGSADFAKMFQRNPGGMGGGGGGSGSPFGSGAGNGSIWGDSSFDYSSGYAVPKGGLDMFSDNMFGG